MAQNRPPPAFQEYAASMLARTDFRVLGLAERGLLSTLRLECWVNQSMPADPARLARVLGFSEPEVSSILPKVMPFFRKAGNDLICPELEDYRQHLNGIREAQSEGGKKGARKTNAKLQTADSQGAGNPQLTQRDTCGSVVKQSPAKQSQTQPLKKGLSDSERQWAAEYANASNGD